MIAGLILAAGESRRMGRDKALLIYRGKTFLETLVDNLRGAGIEKVVVVLGHHADQIQNKVNLGGARVVVNQNYDRGQTSSLQVGLTAAAAESPQAIVLCLVDHPAITSGVIRTLAERFESARSPVIIPTYQCERGHPIVISDDLFPELLALPPDAAANTVIRNYRSATEFVEVNDPGILTDVDDPAAYQRLEDSSRQ